MREKLFSCLLLISLQGGTEDRLKVGGGRGGSVGVSLGHGCVERARKGWWMGEGALRPRGQSRSRYLADGSR